MFNLENNKVNIFRRYLYTNIRIYCQVRNEIKNKTRVPAVGGTVSCKAHVKLDLCSVARDTS